MAAAKRILIFNVNWLGDVLFSTAAIRNIRRNFPEGYIACAIPSRCYPVLKGNPHLDEIIIFDEKDRHKGIMAKWGFIRTLQDKDFDTVFLLHRSFTRALICRLAGIPQRIGYHTKKRAFLLTKKIIPPPKDALHRIDYYLNVIEQGGLKIEDRFTEFFIDDKDREFIGNFLVKEGVKKNDFLVGVNPGGNWLPKRWIKEHWARLSDKLIQDFGVKIIITGNLNDLALAKNIQQLMERNVIFACGIFNLKQLGALGKELDLFISADTGPLHIMNAVGTKNIIALFGPTSPLVTGPYPLKNVVILQKDVGCKVPCYVADCKDSRCMKAITPEDVIEQVKLIKVK